jgi:hypothetical protein
MFNIIAAELIFAVVFLGVSLLTWPTPPWDALLCFSPRLPVPAAIREEMVPASAPEHP